jgi:N-acetylmuramoyl-L-alanine amidase
VVLLLGLGWATGTFAVTVCLDPGHGGTDPGAVGEHYTEKAANLDVSFETRDYLEQVSGVDSVGMTRTTDVYVSLADRCVYANDRGYDRFMSQHHNAFDTTVQGTETYCHSDSLGGQSRDLRDEVHPEIIWAFGYNDRGTKIADFYVLRNTTMPSILGEGSFIDYKNGYDESQRFLNNWSDHSGREGYAYCKGFCDHMGLTPPPYSGAFDATFQAKSHPDTMVSGATAEAWVEYLNTGAGWTPDSTRLGTTVPRNRSSDFYTAGDWISADRPTWVDTATDSAETGRFSFTLTAPTVWTVTQYTEYWGLEQLGKGWFGPPDDEVYFEITVLPSGQPDSMIVDNVDPGCTFVGSWSVSTYGANYGGSKHYKGPGNGSATATWTTPLPAPAQCHVYYWVNQGNYANLAQYIVQHALGTDTVWATQNMTGDNIWTFLGTWNFGSSATVTVTDTAWVGEGLYVVADAIKFIYLLDTTQPEAVQNLTVAKAVSNIFLEWSPVTQDTAGNPESISHYVIYRSEDAAEVPGDSLAGTTDTDYLDAGTAGSTATNYFYVIRATDGSGNESADSGQVGEFDTDLLIAP